MSKRSQKIPQTRVKKTGTSDGDRRLDHLGGMGGPNHLLKRSEKSGLRESQVIEIMRKRLKPRSFKLWRARASQTSHKHQKLFKRRREMDSLN